MVNKKSKLIDLAVRRKAIVYRIASLKQEISSDGYKYSFYPNYDVIELLPPSTFNGIQGLNLDLKKECYVREGIPVFLQERIPPENRVNIRSILSNNKMKYYDPLELYMLNKGRYTGDSIYPIPHFPKRKIYCNLKDENDLYKSVKSIVGNYASGNTVYIDGKQVDLASIRNYFLPIYEIMYKRKLDNQKSGVIKRKEHGSYLGRKPIKIDNNELLEIYKQYFYKKLTAQQALDFLGISRSTFFRRAKSLKIKKNTIETKKGK
ncbi:MAG: hypothetical protein MJ214_00410 [Bacilli bacterium]|nr:hypothetical protein [Bacilli bacterium]